MRLPRRLVGEVLGLVAGELPDKRAGERTAGHISECLSVDDVIAVAGAQQFQKIEPALRAGRAEPGETVVADVRAEAVLRLVAGTGVVDRDPGSRGEPSPKNVLCLGQEKGLGADQQP